MNGYYDDYTMRLKRTFHKNVSRDAIPQIFAVLVTIALLVFITIFALKPVQRIQDAHDAARAMDVENILTAIRSYTQENHGLLPLGLNNGMGEVQLGTATAGCAISMGRCSVQTKACLDLKESLKKYLKSVPSDPNGGSAAMTHYTVSVNGEGVVTVKACGTEGTTDVSASR